MPTTDPSKPDHRSAYHRRLEALDASLIRLGAMVSELIPWGTQVLLNGDMGEAQKLIDADDEIDHLSVEIEESVYEIMVLQAPVASDLRHLTTILKSVGELERSADLVVNICKATRRMYGSPMSPKIRGVIDGMSQEARRLIQLAMEAFADADSALAAALSDIDDELDNLNREMVEAVFAAHHDGAIDLAAAVQLALVARYYERIGDHAVNIGERVGYMVTGWLPELNGSLRTQHRGQSADPVVANPGDGPADGG
ncbi:MAG: phosphate signaling complex protein PhoU [Acidimicrobiales bacterium]